MKRIFHILLLILACLIPVLVSSRYFIQIINTALVFLIIVMGLNFVIGFCGQISMAQTAFWGIGAYTSALLTIKLGLSFWLALPISALLAGIGGFMLGYPTLKLKEFYLGIATVGFGEIVLLVLMNWTSLTNGSDGLPGIPKPAIGDFVFKTDFQFFYIILGVVLLFLFLAVRVKNSRFGRALQAIGNDEIAAEMAGVATHKNKMWAFALSAFYAGAAGSLYAHMIGYISPDLFVFRQTILFMCMLMIGGSGYIAGPIIGTALITILPEWMRFLQRFYMGIFGLVVVVLAITIPNGITGLIEKYLPTLYSWIEPNAEIPVRKKGVIGLGINSGD